MNRLSALVYWAQTNRTYLLGAAGTLYAAGRGAQAGQLTPDVALALVAAVSQVWVHRHVTPLERPRNAAGVPLEARCDPAPGKPAARATGAALLPPVTHLPPADDGG